LPDGTTWVNDCGDNFRPHELKYIPRRPNADLLGAEWMSRYIARQMSGNRIDYLTVSHWHADHAGRPSVRAKTFPSGRTVCGVAALGERFSFGRYLDFEYPNSNLYGTAVVETMDMTRAFVRRAAESNGLTVEPFRPGALNQIRLQHDSDGRYMKSFEIRNLAANGVAWTGHDEESKDYARPFLKLSGQTQIMQNTLSMALRIRYGKFSFYTGGDVNGRLADEDGYVDFEALVARLAGPVTVAKTNHHGTRGSMGLETVSALRASAYVSNVWCPRHVVDENMRNLSSRELYPGDRFLFPTFLPEEPREKWTVAGWWKDVAPSGHVVVKVAPGGGTYKVYVVRTVDEEGLVTAVYSGVS